MSLRGIARIPLYIYKFLIYDALRNATHDYSNVFLKAQKDITQLTHCPVAKASILVLGCGYNYPDVILLSNISENVIGIDIIGAFYRDGYIQTFRDIRNREGTLKALIKTTIMTYRSYRYYHSLEHISGLPIEHQRYKVVSYDGAQMPFEDQTFDVVLSNAVLEHVKSIESLFQEVYRVTKKQGISYHLWHNYYSFSGGHVPKSLCFKHPWGHLRGKYKTHGLNKLTPSQIQKCFSKFFDIIALYQVDGNHWKKGIDNDFRFEREDLLTSDIRNELQAFPAELLLTRAYLIIGESRTKKVALMDRDTLERSE